MRVLDRINLIWAGAVTVLAAVFGAYWYLFAAFMILNIVDYITGVAKAKMHKGENSVKGLDGILKKLGYWVVVAISFFVAHAFTALGKDVGFDLGFTIFIGWYTLVTFIINEIRSILENLTAIGVVLPPWLVKGLEIADKTINRVAGGGDDEQVH